MPDSAPTAACFGEALVVLVPTVPGELEYVHTLSRSLAGAEVNVAVALAAAGVVSAVITRVGDDGFGRYATAELGRLGVDTTAIAVDAEAPTGLYVKELAIDADDEPGSRMHYYRTGSAGSRLSKATLDEPRVRAILDTARVVHTTGITPALSPSAHAAQLALFDGRGPNQLISFDVNWRPALWRGRAEEASETIAEFIRRSDVALVGAAEASALFGTTDPQTIRSMFPEPRWLVVKNDGRDATGFDGIERVDVPALEHEVVEPIGAGDAFAAGLLAGLLAELSLAGCIARAHRWAGRALANLGDHVGASMPIGRAPETVVGRVSSH